MTPDHGAVRPEPTNGAGTGIPTERGSQQVAVSEAVTPRLDEA